MAKGEDHRKNAKNKATARNLNQSHLHKTHVLYVVVPGTTDPPNARLLVSSATFAEWKITPSEKASRNQKGKRNSQDKLEL